MTPEQMAAVFAGLGLPIYSEVDEVSPGVPTEISDRHGWKADSGFEVRIPASGGIRSNPRTCQLARVSRQVRSPTSAPHRLMQTIAFAK
jgi:hypothetical protein